jgi:hypothetical protein
MAHDGFAGIVIGREDHFVDARPLGVLHAE